MRWSRIAVLVVLLAAIVRAAAASLAPNEVVVVVNNHPDVAAASRAVAEYYCAQRGIPTANIAEITAPIAEGINPVVYANNILADTADPPSLVHLLKSRPGFDINDPGSDPTKCIVLCYGVPVKLQGAEAGASLDSALTLLFNRTPWGRLPVSDYYREWCGVANKFCGGNQGERYDFGDFRASAANAVNEPSLETSPSACLRRAFGHASLAGDSSDAAGHVTRCGLALEATDSVGRDSNRTSNGQVPKWACPLC